MKTITFHCPACRQFLEASEDYVGLMVECPACHGVLKVPAEGGEDHLVEPGGGGGSGGGEVGRTARIELPPNLGIPKPQTHRTVVVRRRQGPPPKS